MRELFESVAAKAAGGLQNAGSKFDFEVFAMPGGSVIAVALWCWSMALMMVKSSQHHLEKHTTHQAEIADTFDLDGTTAQSLSESSASRVGCTWRGAQCT